MIASIQYKKYHGCLMYIYISCYYVRMVVRSKLKKREIWLISYDYNVLLGYNQIFYIKNWKIKYGDR